MLLLASRWRYLRPAHSGAEVWPRRPAVGRWPHWCAGPAAVCGGRGNGAVTVPGLLPLRADGELPGEGSWSLHRRAFLTGLQCAPTSNPLSDSVPSPPPPHCLFAVQLPGAAFPPGLGPQSLLRSPPRARAFCPGAPRCVLLLISFFSPAPGRAPSAAVAPAMAHISRWALAVFLGLQQGAPHEATAENGLFLCKL